MDEYRHGRDPGGMPDHPGSLEGITRIRIDCEDVDLGFEGDATLHGVVHLDTQGGNSAPSLVREGSELILLQHGRHRSGRSTTLRLPAEASLPISGRHEKGDLYIGEVYAEIDLSHQSGDVRVNGGGGGLGLEVGKGDVQVHGFAGGIGLQVGSGDVQFSRCSGGIAISLGKGDIQIDSCEGDVSVRSGSGDVMSGDTSGALAIKLGSGDVLLARPRAQVLAAKLGSGDVVIRNGSLAGMAIQVGKGDIVSSAHLILPEHDVSSRDDERGQGTERHVGDDNPITRILKSRGVDLEIGDKGVRFAGPGLQFEASDAGVRVTKGGKSFTADDSGVRIVSVEDEPSGAFSAETGSGDISIDVPGGTPVRVEALISGGDVRSDVPLVSVGRPGPRGSIQRFVGVSDPNATERLSLRVKADRGDIRIRRVAGMPSTPTMPRPPQPPFPPQPPVAPEPPAAPASPVGASSGFTSPDAPTTRVPEISRDQQMRAILDALARGEISVEEADRRLADLNG
ncbi:MAG: DUF4097 family beta strand repeat-containing protein [Chloroflexota bacterium]|nr:DUF4097 family beta strand repeat-containing protein [Chloroflexota bacterium]